MKHSNNFTYEEALEFIHGSLKLGSKLGLSNIRELLFRLGSPQTRFTCIHVAGTNGKGTVSTSLAAVLRAAGYKVGAYTSPFVYRFGERIQINGEPVSEEAIAKNTFLVKEACQNMQADGLAHPTEFEIVTAVGFLCFAEANCEYVALEVGLGGRLDATNVIENPICTAICSIGYDHMEYLGDTLEEITAEKCGILKEGVPAVVYGEQPKAALAVIREKCREKHCEMHIAALPEISECTYRGNTFSAPGYVDLFLPLAGAHMAKNACVTLKIIEVLREKGIRISKEDVYTGFSAVKHLGRLETISEDPLFILDGAHNHDGILALRHAAETLFKGKRTICITGMLADKEYEKAMQEMAHVADHIVCVTVPSPRALPAKDLCEVASRYHKNVCKAESMEEAVCMAFAQKPDVILAFGSLYMLSDVKTALSVYKNSKNKKNK